MYEKGERLIGCERNNTLNSGRLEDKNLRLRVWASRWILDSRLDSFSSPGELSVSLANPPPYKGDHKAAMRVNENYRTTWHT